MESAEPAVEAAAQFGVPDVRARVLREGIGGKPAVAEAESPVAGLELDDGALEDLRSLGGAVARKEVPRVEAVAPFRHEEGGKPDETRGGTSFGRG